MQIILAMTEDDEIIHAPGKLPQIFARGMFGLEILGWIFV